MTNNSISERQSKLSPDLVKQAVNGTSDYHYLMTAIVHQSLMLKAGYIPGKIDGPPPGKNPETWQTKKQHMNAGNLWIFHATDLEHFSPKEAVKVWKYGQILIVREKVHKQLITINCPDDLVSYFMVATRDITSFLGYSVFPVDDPKPVFYSYQLNGLFMKLVTTRFEADHPLLPCKNYLDAIIAGCGYWFAGLRQGYLKESLREWNIFVNKVRQELPLV